MHPEAKRLSGSPVMASERREELRRECSQEWDRFIHLSSDEADERLGPLSSDERLCFIGVYFILRLVTGRDRPASRLDHLTELKLYSACRRGDVGTVRRLLGKWRRLLGDGIFDNDNREMYRQIEEERIRSSGAFGGHALRIACGQRRNTLEIVRLLIKHGANVRNTLKINTGNYGDSPITLPEIRGRPSAAGMVHGASPLHAACITGLRDVAELLIEHGAKVNCTDNTNRTPLMETIGHDCPERMSLEVAQLLLASDAYPNVHEIRSSQAPWSTRSPLTLAIDRKRYDLARLLVDYGARCVFEERDIMLKWAAITIRRHVVGTRAGHPGSARHAVADARVLVPHIASFCFAKPIIESYPSSSEDDSE